MRMQEYVIEKDYKSVYLFLKFNGFSENYIKNLRKVSGYIVLNNKIVYMNSQLKKGDILKVNTNPNTKSSIMHCILPLDIVFEDEYYLIINKPAGLATMPTRSHYTKNLAGAICCYMDNKTENFVLRIINRLDKDTSGLIIVAKDSVAQKELKSVHKDYHALCYGKISEPIKIDSPIATIINKDGYNDNKRIVSKEGKEAITFVTPLKYSSRKNITLIQATLHHGRTHQIRVHLSSIGHPLVGDKLYGHDKNLILNHTALICKSISFIHPFTNKNIHLNVDYPKDFQKVLSTL